MNNRLLKVTVILSVFALAGMAFAGTAVAAPSGIQVNEDVAVRADDPGAFVQFQFDEADSSTSTTFTVDISDFQSAGVQNLGNANLAAQAGGGDTVTSVGTNDPDGDTTPEEIEVVTDAAGSGSSTITVSFGTTATGTGSTGSAVAPTASALHTSGVSPGDDYTLTVSDGSDTDDVTDNFVEDDINIASLSSSGSNSLDATRDISFGATYDTDSENVVSSNSQATVTVNQPELGNATVPIDDAALAAGTFNTGSAGSVDPFTNLIEGQHDLIIASGDVTDGVVSNGDSAEQQNEFDVTDLRVELETVEGEISGEDTVLYNSQQTVEGDIFRTSANAPSQVLADDRVVDYDIEDPGSATVTSGDTNNGEFSVSETWDATSELDDDSDGVDRDTYERLDGLQYNVDVGDGGTPTTGDTGSDTFSTVLDMTYEIDGTPASQADVTFDDTVQISGTALDGSGNPISNYRITAKLYADSGVAAPQKVGTTTTGSNGEFDFTLRLNDGVQNPNIESLVGSDGANLGVHLGTHQVDRAEAQSGDTGGGNTAASPHPAVHYQTVETQPQEEIVEISADDNSPVKFTDTYRIKVTDSSGDAITGTDARVLIEGAFDEQITGLGDLDAGTNFAGNAESDTGLDSDTDDDTVAFQASPNGNGWLNFTATPLQNSFTVNVTGEDGAIDTDVQVTETIQGDVTSGTVTRFAEPDYSEVQSFSIGDADPVNIVDEDVEDPRVGNPVDGAGNLDLEDAGGNANFQSIFSSGPDVVEILPLADSTGERLTNDVRLGFDENFDVDGITVYRAQFELRDENNNVINPGSATGDFSSMEITGAGIDAVVSQDGSSPANLDVSGEGIVDAKYTGPTTANGQGTDLDSDGTSEYAFLIQPSEVEEQNATIDHEIDVRGEDNVTLSLDTSGLEITQFEVDGDVAEEVQPQSTVDVTAVVEDATVGGEFINNGRVRLSQNGTELENFDARTSNTNDGEYSFTGVDVGDRGFDPDDDGIGEEISTLDFTAYQYADANDDQALAQNEVNKATVESLPIALDETLQVDYVAENTSKYSGVDNGTFTLTRGVEYDQIAFELEDEAGNPVNLTDGKNNNLVPLNTYASFDGNGDGEPDLINIQTDDGTPIDVRFDASASNPGAGYYVISDVESTGAGEFTNVTSSSGGLADADSFVFGSDNSDNDGRATATDGADTAPQEYVLNIETPDRSEATNASETGEFVTEDAEVETEIFGVAGNNVPDSVSDTDGDGDIIDELNNVPSDVSQLNTSVSDIQIGTAGIDRLYRVNATVTDALGTPLNDSDFNTVSVDFDGSTDPAPTQGDVFDGAQFEMVDEQDVTVSNNDGVPQPQSGALGLGGIPTTTMLNAGGDDQITLNKETGEFQFDIEVERAGNDGVYEPVFDVEAKSSSYADPTESVSTQSPTIRNPLVNVFGENGGELPESQTSDNQILANDLPNQLRVEAFPADEDGYVLPDGIQYNLAGTFAEDSVGTSTQNINNVATAQLATEGFDEGQVGFFQATPTGTGIGFATLNQQVTSGGTTQTITVRDETGSPVQFDVLSSNRGLNLALTPSNPTAQDDITVTATDDSTGDVVDNVSITVESPTDNTTTILTDEDGEAIIPSSFTDESGTYSIETRRAGYSDSTASFDVAGVPDPAEFEVSNVEPDGATVDPGASITVTADIENIGDQTGEQDVEFRLNDSGEPLDDDAVVATQTVNLTAGETTTASFDVTAPADNGTYDHGVFTNDDSATATLEVNDTGGETFTDPLPGFDDGDAPTDTDGDGLFEDIDGDGQANPTEAVSLWSQLVQNPGQFDDLTQEQVDALDYNDDGELSPADAVQLWSQQVQAQ